MKGIQQWKASIIVHIRKFAWRNHSINIKIYFFERKTKRKMTIEKRKPH